MDTQATQALIRFGLGRKGSEPLPGNPAEWLAQQLRQPDPAVFPGQPSTAQALTTLREQREAFRQMKLDAAAMAQAGAPQSGVPQAGASQAGPPQLAAPPGPRPVQQMFRADSAAQVANAIDTAAPFRERLVWFWTNHFTVSLREGDITAVAGPFIREVIRPGITGRFSDLVLAVMRHPAMLMYLNQAQSIGPDSPAGQRRHLGLNENLARECLELHTVTPAAGYSQADVTSFAKILTGWSIELRSETPGFMFRPNAHEPGAKTLLGREFPPGEEGGVMALRFLAGHPATYASLAGKLVRHFVADDPPAAAVRHIQGALHDTGGDLAAASLALIDLPQAWTPLTKLRAPQDYVVATLRALDLPPDNRGDPISIMGGLGQPLWRAPLPNGWPDRAADWASPEALLRRVDWAFSVASRSHADPAEVADAALGPLLRAPTLDAIRRAGSRRDAMTLLLASPEFMRR